jgi:hypothetical protein
VLELLIKLGWMPDVIHCQGWLGSLIPAYARTIFSSEPSLKKVKLVTSVYNDAYTEKLGADFVTKSHLKLPNEGFDYLKNPSVSDLYKSGASFSDFVVCSSNEIDKETDDFVGTLKSRYLTFEKYKVIRFMTNILSLSIKQFGRFLVGSLLLFSLFLMSCNKDEVYDFNTNNIDETFEFFQADSVVKIKTVREDSLRSDEFTRDLLGVYQDPNFGKTKASLYTQIRLPVLDLAFGIEPVLDSIVLYLKYDGEGEYFGWLNDRMSLNVYELNEAIDRDEAYYSNTVISHKPELLGKWTGTMKPSDNDVIRIVLDSNFGKSIMNFEDFALADDDDFIDTLKGIAIIPELLGSTGSIVYFDLELIPQT